MKVEERVGEFKEDKDWGIVVDEWPLHFISRVFYNFEVPALTNPSIKTSSADTACAVKPGPKIS